MSDILAILIGATLTVRWNIFGWPCALVVLGCLFISRTITNHINK